VLRVTPALFGWGHLAPVDVAALERMADPFDLNRDAMTVRQGARLFSDVGCIECHVAVLTVPVASQPQRWNVPWPYSDLLLHDLLLHDRREALAEKYRYSLAGQFSRPRSMGACDGGTVVRARVSAMRVSSSRQQSNADCCRSFLNDRSAPRRASRCRQQPAPPSAA